MRLSVIVPVYNMALDDRLKWCLDSLVGQTLDPKEYEIIAVDDASTDDSVKIMEEYDRLYDHFHLIRSPENRHQGGAKNLGLKMAKGDWIGFVDADDWIVPDYYERLLTRAEETGADMAGCDYQLTDKHSWEKGRHVSGNREDQAGLLDEAKYRSLVLDAGSLVVKIYKRHIIFGEGGEGSDIFPEHIFYEDNAVACTWMLRARRFEYIREPLYYYYQHDASTVHTLSRRNLEDRMEAGRIMLREARDKGYYEKYKNEIDYKFILLFYVNTLFSAMQAGKELKGAYGFAGRLLDEMRQILPDFQDNPYYRERIHPEEQKLIRMQMKSNLLFYSYYRALYFYRGIRKKLGI
ncbi:glycosyltransferase family 2 protein [Butyrivibrio sp. MC2013]|uniref:glycosyltransferase family 2 protein n=1 Tax=Butyrivibrio sp. MC2013 TaxID=1280686 RepID=UPI0003F8243C|nr:glycosyltransferase family 2 protein [Butyrivibrio sp. MC2013]